MNKIRKALPVILVSILAACSTHHLNTASSTPIADYGKDIRVVVTGGTPEVSDKLSRHIQANLLKDGFNIVNDDKATNLDVAISAFSPGNAALRLTVGLGAGRASLVYKAKYSNAGKVLIDYDGAERFTGAEIAPGTEYRPLANFSGEEGATQILVEEASKNIVDLATQKNP